jgi:RNA-directed DNA polymerase
MQHARQRIRDLTARSRLLRPVEVIVADATRFLRGWAPTSGIANSARQFGRIRDRVVLRLTVFISKRHRRSRAFGRYVFGFASPNQLGLIALHGIVAVQGPSGTGGPPGPTSNAGGERRR